MAERFHPVREVRTDLPDERSVRVVTDGSRYGIEFFNGKERHYVANAPSRKQTPSQAVTSASMWEAGRD